MPSQFTLTSVGKTFGKLQAINSVDLETRFLFPPKSEIQHIHDYLARTGIAEKLYAVTSTLSGGQRQRVAVTRALYQQANTEHNLTLIMSIHNVDLAREFFPRIIGLKSGEITFDQNTVSDDQIQQLYQLTQEQITQ